jgi:glycerol uptake facilitator-like aquaporin
VSLARRASAEFAGTGLLVAAVVGSGIMAQRLSPNILADVIFGLRAVAWSHTHRDGGHLWLGETVATAGLVLLAVAGIAWWYPDARRTADTVVVPYTEPEAVSS